MLAIFLAFLFSLSVTAFYFSMWAVPFLNDSLFPYDKTFYFRLVIGIFLGIYIVPEYLNFLFSLSPIPIFPLAVIESRLVAQVPLFLFIVGFTPKVFETKVENSFPDKEVKTFLFYIVPILMLPLFLDSLVYVVQDGKDYKIKTNIFSKEIHIPHDNIHFIKLEEDQISKTGRGGGRGTEYLAKLYLERISGESIELLETHLHWTSQIKSFVHITKIFSDNDIPYQNYISEFSQEGKEFSDEFTKACQEEGCKQYTFPVINQ
jgi:hypothetical protein